jgi:hypothetical protein
VRNLFCLWNVLSDLIAPPPNGACRRFLGSSTLSGPLMGTLVTVKTAGRRVVILEKIRGCADSRRSRPRSMPSSVRHASEVAPAHRSRRCAGRPARGRPAIPMPAFGSIGDGQTLREHDRQVLRHIMTSFGPVTGFFRSMWRRKRPARWIGRPAGARSLTIKSKSRSSDCAARKSIQYTFVQKSHTFCRELCITVLKLHFWPRLMHSSFTDADRGRTWGVL